MNIFAVSDLHLSIAANKPMDIFGAHWDNHFEKISADWRGKVADEDVVLICGDISWAMRYDDFMPDLAAIEALPGNKVMIKGNHDYWHTSLSKTRALLDEKTFFIQNDCVTLGETAFAGSRCWTQRGSDGFDKEDEKIYIREYDRLKLSLDKAEKTGFPIIVMTHYPPFGLNFTESDYTELIEKYDVRKVIYGHIHGQAAKSKDYASVTIGGIEYCLTSCDHLGFSLKKIDI